MKSELFVNQLVYIRIETFGNAEFITEDFYCKVGDVIKINCLDYKTGELNGFIYCKIMSIKPFEDDIKILVQKITD